MKELTRQDLIDIMYGCTVLGTGGGGDLKGGLELILNDFDNGKKFNLVSLDEVPNDAYIASPYFCGAISPVSEEEEKKYADLPVIDMTPPMRAYQVIEEYFNKDFYGIISTELGGGNTAEAFHVAAHLDKYIIDGDPAGRSVPELQHSTFYVNDVPIVPMAVATAYGDTAIINNVANDFRSEALVRALAVASKNTIGVVDHITTGDILKKSVIPDAISYSLKIGKDLREAKEQGINAAINIAENNDGKILFKGKVNKFNWATIDGFTIGDTYLDGIEEDAGHKYHIWFKNENIVSYKDDELDVSVPDLICVLDKNGDPVTNPNFEEGMELIVIALPAPKEWQTKRGLETFGPRSFGFDFDYVPFKK